MRGLTMDKNEMREKSCAITITNNFVGYWVISETCNIGLCKKPKWLWRKMTKILLGWEYKGA